MQLDLTLRSFLRHCREGANLPLAVIYRASNAMHAGQYHALRQEFASYQNIRFFPEKHFWQDLLEQLARHAGLETRTAPYLRRLWLGPRFSRLRQTLLTDLPLRYVLFLVDDNIFVSDFSLQAAVTALSGSPQALVFSLRLGTNTTYCYMAGRSQALPDFALAGADVLTYDWRSAELDFGYPLEVSSSIYRSGDLLPRLDGWAFHNPNELESRLADHVDQFRRRPHLMCFPRSVTFCNPANRVNRNYRNRAGEEHPATSDFLAEKYAEGFRVDAAAYSGFVPRGCHQEVAFTWLPRPAEHKER